MANRVQPARPSFKPIPYQRTPQRRGLPSWLVIFVIGAVIGAVSVIFLQSSYGPKRLSASEAQKLTDELTRSNIDRQRLQTELEEIRATLEASRNKDPLSNPEPASE